MSLIKWQKEDDLFPSFSSVFDDFFGSNYNKGVKTGTTVPAVNLKENEKNYTIELAAPGLKKEDIKIDLNENVLTISSEKKDEKTEEEKGKFTRKEFSFSSFSRSFTLPENANAEAINASYTDGVLNIDIPKKEVEKSSPKQIDIK